VLVSAGARAAAPFLLSILRQPTPGETGGHLELADAYVALGKVTKPLVDEFAPYLVRDATVQVRHQPREDELGVNLLRAVAFRLLVGRGADDRVFEAALRWFCEQHPVSEQILRKRRTEPRVLEVLRARFAVEQAKVVTRDGRHISYSPDYALLARYLARLGDAEAKVANERVKKVKRWEDSKNRDRYE
nr:hypothetical protein [Deltaproteobacteria bacterium]MDQ3299796.1 hypothetical protein [Myxococcota bacterium]